MPRLINHKSNKEKEQAAVVSAKERRQRWHMAEAVMAEKKLGGSQIPTSAENSSQPTPYVQRGNILKVLSLLGSQTTPNVPNGSQPPPGLLPLLKVEIYLLRVLLLLLAHNNSDD